MKTIKIFCIGLAISGVFIMYMSAFLNIVNLRKDNTALKTENTMLKAANDACNDKYFDKLLKMAKDGTVKEGK